MDKQRTWIAASTGCAALVCLAMQAFVLAEGLDADKVKGLLLERFDENLNQKLDAAEATLVRDRLRDVLEAKETDRLLIEGCRDDIRPLFQAFDTDEEKAVLNAAELIAAKQILDSLLPADDATGQKTERTRKPERPRQSQRSRPTTTSRPSSSRPSSGFGSWPQPFSMAAFGSGGWGESSSFGGSSSSTHEGTADAGKRDADFALGHSDGKGGSDLVAHSKQAPGGEFGAESHETSPEDALGASDKGPDAQAKGDELSEAVDNAETHDASEGESTHEKTEEGKSDEEGEGGARRVRLPDPRPPF